MSDASNALNNFLTNTAYEQSDKNVPNITTACINAPDKNSADGMMETIKLKDVQIANLLATIERQSVQIQQQTNAIENLQQQMSELSASLARLTQQTEKPHGTPKLAPIFRDRRTIKLYGKTDICGVLYF